MGTSTFARGGRPTPSPFSGPRTVERSPRPEGSRRRSCVSHSVLPFYSGTRLGGALTLPRSCGSPRGGGAA